MTSTAPRGPDAARRRYLADWVATEMDSLGYDSIIVTCAPARGILPSFVSRLRGRWPALLMNVRDVHAAGCIRGLETSDDCLSAMGYKRHSIVELCRDEQLRQHLEDQGWIPDHSGEGPLSVHFRRRRGVRFGLGEVKEFLRGDDEMGSVEPYPAILCAPEILEVTLVTPGDPAEDPFSGQMLEFLVSSILGPHTDVGA